MSAIIGHDGPEVPACLLAGVQHRRTGLNDEEPVRDAQMSPHMVDDRRQVEAGTTDPVAERALVQIDPCRLKISA